MCVISSNNEHRRQSQTCYSCLLPSSQQEQRECGMKFDLIKLCFSATTNVNEHDYLHSMEATKFVELLLLKLAKFEHQSSI